MPKYYYDLHTHSCLSPCGDDDNTPNNICGMAALSEIDIVALTDHNSSKNCPAFFTAAEKYGVIPVAGMELTTAEDIHVVCLFEHLSDALSFDSFIENNRFLIKNKPEFFGEQLILDGDDNVIGNEQNLLTNATYISIDDVKEQVEKFGGIAYPAHIDRDSNGMIAILGSIPENCDFKLFELHDGSRIDEFSEKYGIDKSNFIVSSDSHYLTSFRDKEYFFELDCERDPNTVRKKLFELLRNKK